MALASCGGGNDVASGGAGTGVTSASAVSAGGPNGATANSAASTSVTSTKAAMDRIGTGAPSCPVYYPTTYTCPAVSPTPACQNDAKYNPSCLPIPTQFTPASTASGLLIYQVDLPYVAPISPNINGTQLNLSANYTDLLISTYVSGALLGRLITDTYPGLQFNKDYLYGTIFSQLLQESGQTYYSSTGSGQNLVINPTLPGAAGVVSQEMTANAGGPWQMNNWGRRLEYWSNDPTKIQGAGFPNYMALQQGIGYTIVQQDCGCEQFPQTNFAPDSFNQKYFGPLLTTYFQFSDLNSFLQTNNYGNNPNVAACFSNLKDPRAAQDPKLNILDLVLNSAYNAGTSSPVAADFMYLCANMYSTTSTQVKSMGDYSMSVQDYITKITSTPQVAGPADDGFYYPRQIRLYLDEIYNQPTFSSAVITGNTKVNLSVNDIAAVFANVFGTLSYVNSTGNYGYIASADSTKAFTAAVATSGLSSTSSLNISVSTDRAQFFNLLDAAILNLQTSLKTGNSNFTGFNATTQSTLPGMPATSPQTNPPLTK
jgi:hypothetical protein